MTQKSVATEVMGSAASGTNLADLIWKTAELLRGAFREPEYRRVILPFTVLRRLDCLLEPTKAKVLAKHQEIAAKGYDLRMFLAPIRGYPFWNHSAFTLKGMLDGTTETGPLLFGPHPAGKPRPKQKPASRR